MPSEVVVELMRGVEEGVVFMGVAFRGLPVGRSQWRLPQSRDRGLRGSTHCGYCVHGSHLLLVDHDHWDVSTPGDAVRNRHYAGCRPAVERAVTAARVWDERLSAASSSTSPIPIQGAFRFGVFTLTKGAMTHSRSPRCSGVTPLGSLSGAAEQRIEPAYGLVRSVLEQPAVAGQGKGDVVVTGPFRDLTQVPTRRSAAPRVLASLRAASRRRSSPRPASRTDVLSEEERSAIESLVSLVQHSSEELKDVRHVFRNVEGDG
jgi:hypothetical protein